MQDWLIIFARSVMELIACLVLGYSRLLYYAPSEWSICGDHSMENCYIIPSIRSFVLCPYQRFFIDLVLLCFL